MIAGGGFTLLSEAVYLHKPMLSVPVRGQFEQVLNARYLEHEGYGLALDRLDAAGLSTFLDRLPAMEARLADYRQDGNEQLLAKLDRLLLETRGLGEVLPALED